MKNVIPEGMTYDIEHFTTFMANGQTKGKNYILITDNGKMKMFGTAFKNARYHRFGRKFMEDVAWSINNNNLESIRELYLSYVNSIVNHQMDIHDISLSQEIKRSVEEYEKTKVMRDRVYEMVKEHGLTPANGDRLRFYQTVDGKFKPIELYDKSNPDEDVHFLLEALEKYKERFNGILSDEDYAKLLEPVNIENIDDYKYVDATNEYIEDGFSYFDKWERVSLTTFNKYLQKRKSDSRSVFSTLQKFKNKKITQNEPFIMPFYYDLDSENIEDSLKDLKMLVAYFTKLGIPRQIIQTYFSGKKGFHFVINEKIMGIKPSNDLNYVMKYVKDKLSAFLKLKTGCESSESKRKMLRTVNTVNLKSGLYKIAITDEDMKDINTILKKAKYPQENIYENGHSEYSCAVEWWKRAIKNYKPRVFIAPPSKIDVIPMCIKDLFTNSIQAKGTRHRAILSLASFFKSYGFDENKTKKLLSEWSKKIPKKFSDTTDRSKTANVTTVVKSVYSSENYLFNCPYILSLPWKIKCNREDCKFNKDKEDAKKV